MAQYIPKDALVAEIERRISEINLDIIEDWRYRLQREHDIEIMKNILSLIETLEVKEVELEKEEKSNLMRKCVHNAYQQGYKTGKLMTTNKIVHKQEVDLEKEIEEHAIHMPMSEFTHDSEAEDFYEWARKEFKHFFELGVQANNKTQKGEEA